MAGREEEEEDGSLLPGAAWVWESSGDGRWPHAPRSRSASLCRCGPAVRVSEAISSGVQRTWQVWGPALSGQAPSVTLHTCGL